MYLGWGNGGNAQKGIYFMLDSGPYTISSYLHAPFFSMLSLLIWTFEELAAVTACCLCIFFLKHIGARKGS